MDYCIQIRKDDDIANKFMVVILKPVGTSCNSKAYRIVGIPLRGVTRKTADTFADPLRFAFEYGLRAQIDQLRTFVQKEECPRVAKITDPEDE